MDPDRETAHDVAASLPADRDPHRRRCVLLDRCRSGRPAHRERTRLRRLAELQQRAVHRCVERSRRHRADQPARQRARRDPHAADGDRRVPRPPGSPRDQGAIAGRARTILGNGVVGGFAVRGDLHPFLVQSHFLLAMLSIGFGLVAVHRARPEGVVARSSIGVTQLSPGCCVAFGALVAASLVTGTVVTGAGPHAGDETARRYGFDISTVAEIHSVTVWVAVASFLASSSCCDGTDELFERCRATSRRGCSSPSCREASATCSTSTTSPPRSGGRSRGRRHRCCGW